MRPGSAWPHLTRIPSLGPNWVSAHINGLPYFDTIGQEGFRTPIEAEQDLAMGERIDAIEKVARGGELSDAIVREAVDRMTPGRSFGAP